MAQLTPLYLKSVSQKFDLKTIFILDISKKGFNDISLIQQCQNLLLLNLSHNQITSISGIDKLKKLQRLNISNNLIINISPLQECKDLQHLEAQRNKIKDMSKVLFDRYVQYYMQLISQQIEPLKACPKLRVLYLQQFDQNSGKNPICQGNESYRMQIFNLLPQLVRLDGQKRGEKVLSDQELIEFQNISLQKPQYKSHQIWFSNQIKQISTKPLAIQGQIDDKMNDLKGRYMYYKFDDLIRATKWNHSTSRQNY